ncbi:twin-arginine translocase subunit TatC [Hyphomonas sp. FCG-A18]|uniref:twin-arginine translocase subunit TatC n=1 Tax=Hyphomonas sp. FCG-A18 TaxID=3080019 RepID=UPI002B2FAFBD|nr:twin-arginine translocase subunit TatC [Hyphomonas sp. FCG-A18]
MTTELPDDQKPDIIEDEVEASRAPLLSHLTELRNRLIWCMAALGVATIACFFIAKPIYNLLVEPLLNEAVLGRGKTDFELIYTAPLEVFFVQLKLALFGGLFLAFPVIAWQLYGFVAPGLYKNERYAFLPFLIAAPILFTIGAVFVYYAMLPLIARFALSFEQLGGEGIAAIVPQIKVSEYLSLVMALMIAFGLSFQLPVILSLLGKVGIIGAETLRKGRKYALVGILAASAFFTPPDMISQIMLTVPVYGLYEASIWIVAMFERKAQEEEASEA